MLKLRFGNVTSRHWPPVNGKKKKRKKGIFKYLINVSTMGKNIFYTMIRATLAVPIYAFVPNS